MTSVSFARILPRAFLYGFVSIIIATCSGGGGSPTGNGDDDGIRETKRTTITPEGGAITLEAGASVVFPAGAVDAATEYTVRDIDPGTYFDGDDVGRVVVAVDGAVTTFDEPVEVRVPLPAGMTEADSTQVFAGVIDEESGAVMMEPATIHMIDGAPYLVVEATHFSSRVAEWLFGPEPPASYTSLTVPYFNQGASDYCWATTIQMVTEAAGHSSVSDISDIIGFMKVDEGGISSGSFRYSPTIAGIVMARNGVKPDRKSWGYLSTGSMKNYLKAEIGLRHHPVALFNGAWEHAVVVVGYDGDTFYIHDPQSTTPSSIGYTPKTWQQIVGNMGVLTNMVTLVVPKALDASRPEITTHIMPGAFDFIKPKQSASDQSAYYRFSWDYTKKDGYSFKEANTTAVDKLPATVTELRQNGDIEVYNSSRTTSKSVSVWLEITAMGAPAGEGRYSTNKQITVGPNSLATVTFDDIDVKDFRWGTGDTEYYLTVKALDGGSLSDESSLTFVLPPAELHIDAISPSSGPKGTEVTINGTGFGTDMNVYRVVFGVGSSLEMGATEIVSWKDTEIKVKVPDKAATGNVEVREKGVMATRKSNGVPFTVSDTVTYSGTSTHTRVWVSGTFANFTAVWTLNAAYPDSTIGQDTYSTGHVFNVKTQVPLTLTVTVSAEQLLTSYEYIQSYDSTRVVITYHDLKPLDAVADPDDDETSVRVSGTFPYTLTGTGGNYVLSMNLSRGDNYSYDSLQLMPLFEYKYDRTVYSIREANYGELLSSEVNDRDVLYPVPFSFHIGVNTRWMYWPED